MKIIKKLLLMGLILVSCQEDDETLIEKNQEGSQTQSQKITNEGQEMIIGRKLNNPFSIDNLNKAREFLNEKRSKNGYSTKMLNLQATHYYIKFLPTNESHCKTLLEIDELGDITLHAYPLDSKIIQEGTSPLAEGITDPGLNELYAVIPIGNSIPKVPYKILDRIIPEPESPVLEAASFFLTDNTDELTSGMTLEKIAEIDSNNQSKNEKSLKLFGEKWRPQGNLLIFDTNLRRGVGLRQAKVSIGRWFKWRRVHTNNNGTFVSPSNFRSKKVRVRTKWRSNIATIRKSWNEILGIAVSDHAMTVFRNNNGPTRTIPTSDEHLWYKGTVHNALVKVNEFHASKGMAGQIKNINVWVHPGGNNRGAALMLRKYTWSVSVQALFSSWWTWLASSIIFPTNLTLSHLYPDVSLSLGRGTNTREIDRLVFHEGAHVLHALQTGGGFWGDLFRAETNNIVNGRGSYGNGTQPSNSKGELIALSEGWATFIENRMMLELYNEPNTIENFTMINRPNSFFQENDRQHWFATGLFWDMYDVNDDQVRLFNGTTGNRIFPIRTEDLEGDYQPLFQLLDSNTRRINHMENKIISAYPQIEQRTRDIFNAYGY